MKKALLILFVCLQYMPLCAQKQVAITIDDMELPNPHLPDDYGTGLLDTIQALHMPAAIFISEGLLFKGDTTRHFFNIEKWLRNPLITAGSHTYSHLYYSDTTYDFYVSDIERGLAVSVPLAKKCGQSLRYFRFPFNCLGKDSIQHERIKTYLAQKRLILTPFSVESEDWAYNYVYEYYLVQKDTAKALEIGKRYVRQTLAMFTYLEDMCRYFYKRPVKQIYLCHDNLINQQYLGRIVRALQQRGYRMISLDAALKDKAYQAPDHYYRKWGFSWIYRYQYEKLKSYTPKEPDDLIYKEYKAVEALSRK